MMQNPIASNGWRKEDAELVVVSDGLKPLIGRNLYDALGISVTQILNPIDVNMINNINTVSIFNKSCKSISKLNLRY